MSEIQVRVGQQVRALRRLRGLSQAELGLALEMHRTWIGAVERGERNLSLRSVEKLATRLGVHPVTLMAPDGWTPS